MRPARSRTPGLLLGLGLALAVAGHARAEEAAAAPEPVPERMEERVVTASVAPTARGDLTSSTSVISGDEIRFLRYDDVSDVLALVAGVYVDQPGSRGARSSIHLRGLDPNQTLVLVDGVRLGDPNNSLGGSFDLSTLSTDDIERIEVVRGPISAVHGSDALAGAVNVITKSGRDGDELVVDGSGGRFGYGRGLATVRGARGPFDASLSGSWVDDGEPEAKSRYRAGNLHASFGAELPRNARLRTTLRYVNAKSRAFPEASGGEELAVNRELERRRSQELSLALALDQRLDEALRWETGLNYYRRREKRDVPSIPPAPGDPFTAVPAQRSNDLLYRTRWNANATWTPRAGLSLTAGGDVSFENGNSVSDIDFGFGPVPGSYKDDRIFGGPLVEGSWEPGWGLSLRAGLRVDLSSEDDTQWTPRVGARWAVPETPLTLRGSWGEGFKLPAFFSRSDPTIGNPDLDSEKSRGWDVGFELRLWEGRVTLEATWFEIRVEDLIDFDFASFQLVNRGEVRSEGAEVTLVALLPGDWVASGTLTRVETDILDTPVDLRRRPRWRTSADLQWTPHERVELGLTSVWVGSSFDESVPTGPVKLDDWVRFDFRGSLRVWRELRLYLAIDNLFDADYEQAVGVPAMGIRPRAGVRAVF